MSKLGELDLGVITSLAKEYSNTVPSKAVENGYDISDNIQHSPIKISLEGTITENPFDKKTQLQEMRKSNDIYKFYDSGNFETFKNMAITQLSLPDRTDVSNGFTYRINLKQIKTVSRTEIEVKPGKDPVTDEEIQKEEIEYQKQEPEEITKNEEVTASWGSFQEKTR